MKGDKRLAVRTEDHPLEYGKFEGTIPAGHYGAGEVRIFDDGWYEPVEWDRSKVCFRLHGRRYPGLEFHLVKTKQNWLAFLASAQPAPLIAVTRAIQADAGRGRPHRRSTATTGRFEPKLDGIRCLAEMTTGETVLRTRTGPRRDGPVSGHPHHPRAGGPGERASSTARSSAFDAEGHNSFEALQQRMNLANEREIERIAKQIPVALVVFDLLWLDGHETTGLSLQERRELLEPDRGGGSPAPGVTHVEGEGVAFTADRAGSWAWRAWSPSGWARSTCPGDALRDWRKIKLRTRRTA